MCQWLEVKRSGYYRWVKKMNDDIDPIHSKMIELVKEVAKAAENVYGSKACTEWFRYPVSRQKSRKLVYEAGV